MSVLKQKRTTSKAEFINTANQIYVETLNFLTRLSARYSRLIAEPVAKLAGEIVDHAEKANSIFPSDPQRVEMRKAHLIEARASLMALDVRLTHCYLICNQNPEGCFTTAAGKPVKPKDAEEKLDMQSFLEVQRNVQNYQRRGQRWHDGSPKLYQTTGKWVFRPLPGAYGFGHCF